MIYLDYNATTPVDPRVLEAMLPFFTESFGNPSSGMHMWGWKAQNAVSKSRESIAQFLNCSAQEIYFTSGASESNNWSFFGLFHKLISESNKEPIHFITSQAEHSSVLESMKALEKLGVEVSYLPVNKFGQVDPETLKSALRPHTRLISLMWINNEVGSINNISALGKIARDNHIYFHSDATQALGKVKINLQEIPVDMLSFSGHKIYGPKGIGGLYVRSKDPRVSIEPLIFGGGQEKGLRSGTLNVPGIVGLGKAVSILAEEMDSENARLLSLRDTLWGLIQESIPGSIINGHPEERSSNNLNFSNPNYKIDMALPKLQKLGFSTGSACGSGGVKVSHVLTAMGCSVEHIEKSMRLSLGRQTSLENIQETADILKKALSLS